MSGFVFVGKIRMTCTVHEKFIIFGILIKGNTKLENSIIFFIGEEAIKPERSIPLSIGLSLLFVFLAYFGMSSTITLALPYCQQVSCLQYIDLFMEMIDSLTVLMIGIIIVIHIYHCVV